MPRPKQASLSNNRESVEDNCGKSRTLAAKRIVSIIYVILLNVTWLDPLQESIENVFPPLKVFKDIHLAPPLLMRQGAPVDPLDLASLASKFSEFEKSHRANIDLIAGGNLFWINVFHEPMPGVPINRAGIKFLVDFFFQRPARVDGLQVPVTALSDVAEQKLKGQAMIFLSPQVPLNTSDLNEFVFLMVVVSLRECRHVRVRVCSGASARFLAGHRA